MRTCEGVQPPGPSRQEQCVGLQSKLSRSPLANLSWKQKNTYSRCMKFWTRMNFRHSQLFFQTVWISEIVWNLSKKFSFQRHLLVKISLKSELLCEQSEIWTILIGFQTPFVLMDVPFLDRNYHPKLSEYQTVWSWAKSESSENQTSSSNFGCSL